MTVSSNFIDFSICIAYPPINTGMSYSALIFRTNRWPAPILSGNVIEINTTSGLLLLMNLKMSSVGIDVPILNTLKPLIDRYVSKTSHPRWCSSPNGTQIKTFFFLPVPET